MTGRFASDDGGTPAGGGASEGPVAATVMLQPAERADAPSPILATPPGQEPVAETLTDVAAAFVRAGFQAGPPTGPAFPIEAAPDVFSDFFGVRLRPGADGGWTTESGAELPLDALPREVRGMVTAVVLGSPADRER